MTHRLVTITREASVPETPTLTVISKGGLFRGEFDSRISPADAQAFIDRHEEHWLLEKAERSITFIGDRD